jgi:hypothetical protein
MSFLTGTQAELLYAMPGSGGAVISTATTGTGQLLSGGSSATLPAYSLPAYFFPNTYGAGRSILIEGGGSYSTGSATKTLNFGIFADTAIGTSATAIATTGAIVDIASITNGAWMFQVLLTCTAVGTSSTVNAVGTFTWGAGNNAATTTSGTYMIGAPNSAVSLSNATPYFLEVFAWWSATTTSQTITMTNYLIWGLN